MASSVGSSVRITRHSRSRIETASLWSGALTTTRGRESAGPDPSPFPSGGRPLLGGDPDQARPGGGERGGLERPLHPHPPPPPRTEQCGPPMGGGETDLSITPHP